MPERARDQQVFEHGQLAEWLRNLEGPPDPHPAALHRRQAGDVGAVEPHGARVGGNPYDGHTLRHALEQVAILTDQRPDLAVVDRGYRGHGEERTSVLISGTRRGLTPKPIADLRRRSAIEAEIGHMKTDGRLSRCPLKGTLGDAVFAVLNACGHNIRKILAHLRAWLAWIVAAILNAVYHPDRQYQPVTSA